MRLCARALPRQLHRTTRGSLACSSGRARCSDDGAQRRSQSTQSSLHNSSTTAAQQQDHCERSRQARSNTQVHNSIGAGRSRAQAAGEPRAQPMHNKRWRAHTFRYKTPAWICDPTVGAYPVLWALQQSSDGLHVGGGSAQWLGVEEHPPPLLATTGVVTASWKALLGRASGLCVWICRCGVTTAA